MSNGNLNPIVLIPGLTGSRLVTKGRYFPNPVVMLWINLTMMFKAGEQETNSEDENVDLATTPEVIGDVPEYKIDPKAVKEPDPWWKEEYFNTKHYVFLEKDGGTEPLDIQTTLTQAGAENSTLKFIGEYTNDPYFSGEENGSKGLECPPVAKLDVIYAPGTPTEVGAYYTKVNDELEVKKMDGEEGSFVIKNGLLLETSKKTTQKIDGSKNSGDGVVPYASMVYFKKWQQDPSVKTTITEHPLVYDDL